MQPFAASRLGARRYKVINAQIERRRHAKNRQIGQPLAMRIVQINLMGGERFVEQKAGYCQHKNTQPLVGDAIYVSMSCKYQEGQEQTAASCQCID